MGDWSDLTNDELRAYWNLYANIRSDIRGAADIVKEIEKEIARREHFNETIH